MTRSSARLVSTPSGWSARPRTSNARPSGSFEQERSLLERKIDELRAFEREYRSRLKSYLEGQLRELEAKAAVVPGRAPAGQPAAATAAAAPSYNGPLPSRSGYAPEPTPEPAGQTYPFGERA